MIRLNRVCLNNKFLFSENIIINTKYKRTVKDLKCKILNVGQNSVRGLNGNGGGSNVLLGVWKGSALCACALACVITDCSTITGNAFSSKYH